MDEELAGEEDSDLTPAVDGAELPPEGGEAVTEHAPQAAASVFGGAMLQALEAKLGRFSHEPQAPPTQPVVLVISGPSGVGKDAVINELGKRRDDLSFVVTATTRAKRDGEEHGRDYFFISTEEFEQMIEEGELLEHAVVYGEYKGIPKQQVRDALSRNTDVVLRLDVQGAATVRKLLPEAVSIFLVAESEASLAQRLVARKTEPLDKLLLRVQTAREETRRSSEFEYLVVNASGDIDRTVNQLCSIIDAEKMKSKRRRTPIAL